MTTPNLDLTIAAEKAPVRSLPATRAVSASPEVRAQQAASAALTPPITPSPAQDEKTKKQVDPIPTTLVDGAAILAPSIESKEQLDQAITAMIPDEDDVEEVFFDPDSLIQESEHAQDIVQTLSPFIKESWDAKHGEGSWETTLLTAYMSAEVNYSVMEDASISANSEDLAWIAVSKLAAQAAGISHECCCPQFSWENTSEKGVENTTQLARWQELKTYLLSGAAALEEVQSEEGSQPQPQTALASLQNGLSHLATTMTSNKVGQLILVGGAIWALSSLPIAAAAAAPFLGNATSAAVCVPGSAALGGCLSGAASAATGTVAAIASGTVAAIASTASVVSGLVPYVAQSLCVTASAASGTVAAIGSTASAIVPYVTSYVAPVCAVTSPLVVSILGNGVPNATNFTSPPLPTCPLGDAPPIATTTNASWLGILGYLPPLVYSMSRTRDALTAVSDGSYRRAAANLAGGALPIAAMYYLGPVAGTITAAALTAAGSLWPTAPVDSAEALPTGSHFYERRNVVCKKGIFNIKVPGPAGLSPEQQEDLIKAFISEVLDKNPVKTMVGDKIEFEFPEPKKWTAHVTPREGHSAGRTLEGEKTYNDSPSHRTSIKKLETLRKVMINGAHAFAVMQALRSITMDNIPNNAPAVTPVSFSNAPLALGSTMQAMLAIPEIRTAMENSHHPVVNSVANAYIEKVVPGNGSDPVDLAALEQTLNPDSRNLDGKGYGNALLDLMADHQDDLSDILLPKLEINHPAQASTIAENWIAARRAPIYPKLSISLNSTEESLQTLVGANQSHGTTETQFYSVPNFLQISVANAQPTDRAAKINDKLELDLGWEYIEPNARNAAAPKPKYALQNIILHTAQGEVTYQKTVENVNGEPQLFFWKRDPAIEGGASVCIDFDEFCQAANSKDKKDLFFLKQEGGAVQEEEILASRTDSDSAPKLAEANNVAFEYDNTVYDMTMPPNDLIELAVDRKSSGGLKDAVTMALQAAVDADVTEITLPVPVGEDAEGMNWPIGIMWYAAQEFMKTLPPVKIFKVRLAIQKAEKNGERRDHLVQQIDKADEIYQQSRNFAEFQRAWTAYSKPARRGLHY